ncbi:hypothetical protein AB2B38_010100 [Balneola sp. MJW-20]|uniref:hypothetical protein n=1 Tax=Gracilimonas aurantiaca TaxID=3234185 RepID=UPI003466C93B
MSSFSLTDETAIDVLIFWIESSDGAISFEEESAVKRIMDNMHYDLQTYRKTLSHLNALSTEGIKEAENDAIEYITRNFSDRRRQLTYSLLESIATSDSKLNKTEEEKLELLKKSWGL